MVFNPSPYDDQNQRELYLPRLLGPPGREAGPDVATLQNKTYEERRTGHVLLA